MFLQEIISLTFISLPIIKNFMRLSFTVLFFIFIVHAKAQTVLYNNGALARMNSGCIVFINDGDVKNNTGIIKNAGLFTIENDFINNDSATAGSANGLYKIQRDFVNNNIFIANQGEVLLYGANQQITGSSITTFYDLTLTGSGIKSQTIDARVGNSLDLGSVELATGTNNMHVDNASPAAVIENGGFVSSLGNGRLAWATNQVSQYVYPVGSSLGTPRIRPVRITPAQNSDNIYAIRFANTDPNNDGYDRSVKAIEVCGINENFYHLIDRTSGTSAAGIAIYYEDPADGSWTGIGHWQNIPQWENTSTAITGTIGTYELLSISNWNDFSYPPFSLINFGGTVTISVMGNTLTANATAINYQWYYNGNPIPGATSETYTATESGNYYVIAFYGNGCQSQSQYVELSVNSVYENEEVQNLRLFPNPSSESVFVQADINSTSNVFIHFTNLLGQQLLPAVSLINVSSVNEKIDVSQFANGVYFISLISENGQSSLPFVKN